VKAAAVQRRPAISVAEMLVIGVVGGAFSGLLGVGGGIAMVPLLVLWAGYGQRDAHATSLAAIIPIACVGVLTYGLAGEVHYAAGAALAAGAVVGARLGTEALSRLSERRLKVSFGVFLIAVAVSIVVR
jgi:uncharacterized membrane protein YfcA